MQDLMIRERLIAEGAAATAVAAALHSGLDLTGRRVAILLTGRNVDVGDGSVFHRFPQQGDRSPADVFPRP
jgi:threonine dehydratase